MKFPSLYMSVDFTLQGCALQREEVLPGNGILARGPRPTAAPFALFYESMDQAFGSARLI